MKAPIALLLVMLLAACGGDDSSQTQAPDDKDSPRLVKTLIVGRAGQAPNKAFPAKVSAGEKTELAFEVDGPLIELNVVEGQVVRQGQRLARVDPRDYQNALAVAQAEFNEAERQYRRYSELIKSQVAPITKAELDQQRKAYEVAKAALAQARKALNDTSLHAPFDGLVAARLVNNFENVAPKQPVLRLENIATVEIVIDVPEQDIVYANSIKALRKNAAVGTVTFAAHPERRFAVKVKEYATQADPNTQTYRVTLVMPAPNDLIVLPGMTATFSDTLALPANAGGFTMPATAIGDADSDAPYAYVVDPATMTLERRPLRLGKITASSVQVVDGLRPDERIVAAGVGALEPGQRVRFYHVGMLGG